MDPVGRFDMPFVGHAEEVTYVRALHRILSGTEDDWGTM